MFNLFLLHIRVYCMGIYFYLMIAYILLLFVSGGKGRCRIYIHISLPYSFQDVPRTEHVHYSWNRAKRVESHPENADECPFKG